MRRSGTTEAASNAGRHASLRRLVLTALATAVAYYLGAWLGASLRTQPEPVSTLWPPNAILLGILLLVPVRAWPVMLLAVLPAHLLVQLHTGVPLPMALLWYVSNCTEAVIGAVCIRRMIAPPVSFDSFRRVVIFVVLGAGLAPFLSSFLDAGFVHWNRYGNDPNFWSVWRARFFSNALSMLTIVPAIVHLRTHRLAQ